VAICGQWNISITIKVQEVKDGWFGKPKGMLQMLWECGWIDLIKEVNARSMCYSKDERKESCFETWLASIQFSSFVPLGPRDGNDGTSL
jgi:hypothetical protein